MPSEATKAIVDIDLDELPALDPSHKEYHRRQTDRTKIAAQNRANESKRFSITMAERPLRLTAVLQRPVVR